MSLVSVVCCQVEVCAMGQSLDQMTPTECDVCDQRTSQRMPRPTRDVEP